jgi:hypothetical protein
MQHPIMGVWTVEGRVSGRPRVDRATYAFHADGILSIAGSEYAANGTWQPLSDSEVTIFALLPTPQGEGAGGWLTMPGRLNLAADGASFQGDAVAQRPTPSGTPMEYPTTLTAQRLGR